MLPCPRGDSSHCDFSRICGYFRVRKGLKMRDSRRFLLLSRVQRLYYPVGSVGLTGQPFGQLRGIPLWRYSPCQGSNHCLRAMP